MARYVSRCTGFDVTVLKEGADDPSQAILLPVRFACGIPSKHLLDTLGITATPISQHLSLSWPRKMLMGQAEAEFHELRIPISDDQQKARDVLKQLQEYEPALLAESERRRVLPNELKTYTTRTLLLTLLTLPILVLAWGRFLPNHQVTSKSIQMALATGTQILGWPLFSTSIRVLWYLHAADLGLLATLSITLSYTFSVVAFAFQLASQEFADPFFETSALLVTLIYAGKTIQIATRRAVGGAIDKLRDLQAKEVLVRESEDSEIIEKMDARLLQVGDIVRILPDSQVPVDGLVVVGTSAVDESSVNGESVPAGKAPGSLVMAGTYNIQGTLEVQVTRMTQENSLAIVANLVQLAQASRTSLQDLADTLAARILPVALFASISSFLVWLFVTHYKRGESWADSVAEAVTYAIAVMASSCPCALALAVRDVLTDPTF